MTTIDAFRIFAYGFGRRFGADESEFLVVLGPSHNRRSFLHRPIVLRLSDLCVIELADNPHHHRGCLLGSQRQCIYNWPLYTGSGGCDGPQQSRDSTPLGVYLSGAALIDIANCWMHDLLSYDQRHRVSPNARYNIEAGSFDRRNELPDRVGSAANLMPMLYANTMSAVLNSRFHILGGRAHPHILDGDFGELGWCAERRDYFRSKLCLIGFPRKGEMGSGGHLEMKDVDRSQTFGANASVTELALAASTSTKLFVFTAACAAALGGVSLTPPFRSYCISVAALALTPPFSAKLLWVPGVPAVLALFPALVPAHTHCPLSSRHAATFTSHPFVLACPPATACATLVRPTLAVLWRALPYRLCARASSGCSFLSASPSTLLYPPHLPTPQPPPRNYALCRRSIPLPRFPLYARASFTATSASAPRAVYAHPPYVDPPAPAACICRLSNPALLGRHTRPPSTPTTYAHSVPVFPYSLLALLGPYRFLHVATIHIAIVTVDDTLRFKTLERTHRKPSTVFATDLIILSRNLQPKIPGFDERTIIVVV
ncbi:hypothetical protein C8F04DRAFT_1393735 [Mycena alexandri]|uniref:Uncharacterized protein n=1 Tax=Mycena alexandri TaxID=1745969 RepID=A0AAD6X798_9AGAR|nr:hypothetical protein C8F04DRAFT_1393735 [Mycena alexandri]